MSEPATPIDLAAIKARADAEGPKLISFEQVFWGGLVTGIVLAVLLIAAVFWTGSTFGQRCAKAYPNQHPAIEQCVERLASGGTLAARAALTGDK